MGRAASPFPQQQRGQDSVPALGPSKTACHSDCSSMRLQQTVAWTCRSGTSPDRPATSSLRPSGISIPQLTKQTQGQQPKDLHALPRPTSANAAGNSCAPQSPRVLGSFASAVRAGSSSDRDSSADGRLQSAQPGTAGGEFGSCAGNRPCTPCFQPLAQTTRPATALACLAPLAASDFTINAAYSRADSEPAGVASVTSPSGGIVERPTGAYPQPPSTAPARAGQQFSGSLAQPQTGSLASFGISAAAFVAMAPKAGGMAKVGASARMACEDAQRQDGKAELFAPTLATLLATASLSRKADLR